MEYGARVAIARSLTLQLHDELSAMSPAELATPGACGDWSVIDVAGHLARAGETYGLYLRRALEGRADPPEGASFYTNLPAASALVRDRSIEYRKSLGEDWLSVFERNGLGLVEQFAQLEPSQWSLPTFHPIAVLPAEQLLGWRVAELAVHRWDIMNRLGRDARLPPASIEHILDWLPRWLQLGYRCETTVERPLLYRVTLNEPAGTAFDLSVGGETLGIVRDGHEPADVVFDTDAETFILLSMGRLTWSTMLAAGRVRTRSEARLVEAFPGWFRSF